MRKIYVIDYLFGFMFLSVVWVFLSGFFLAGFWFAGPLCLFPVFILFFLVFLANLIICLIKCRKINTIELIYVCFSGVLFLVDYYLIFISHILDINLHIG